VSTLGRKLAPKIPRYFSEVVLATRTLKSGVEPLFTWATVDLKADLKNRVLPASTSLKPDYAPVVEAYRKRLKLIATSQGAPKDAA
jgi:hypothetical protein